MKKSTNQRTGSGSLARHLRGWCALAALTLALLPATLKAQTLSLDMKNVPLKEVFASVEKNSGYRFLYKTDDITGVTAGPVFVTNSGIEAVMEQCLAGTQLTYEKDGNLIIVRKKDTPPAQKVSIGGRVTDQNGMGVAGATIVVEGTNTGTVTDASGRYKLETFGRPGTVLSFFQLGKESRQVTYTGQSDISVVLREDETLLESIVVTGYQDIKHRQSASAVTTVLAKDIRMDGVSTIDQWLQGHVAGLTVTIPSGEPTVTPKIRIRGNSTINGNKAPVWVVDGVILEQLVPFTASDLNSEDAEYLIGNAIAGLNPQDIETITVLKDASATAIYGIKAANGVIVISTKSGSAGAPRISYYGDFAFNARPSYNQFDRMNSQQRMELSKEIADAGFVIRAAPVTADSYEGLLQMLYRRQITQEQFSSQVMAMQTRNTDWMDLLFRNTFSYAQNLNVSGGTQNVKYYFSAGFNNTPGAVRGSDNKRFTSLAKIDVKVNKWLDFMVKMDYNLVDNTGYHSSVKPFDMAYKYSRTLAAYNEDGSYHVYDRANAGVYYNLLKELDQTGKSARNNDYSGLLSLNIKIAKGLSYNGVFSLSNGNSSTRDWATDRSYYISNLRGYEYQAYAETDSKYITSKLPYGGILRQGYVGQRGYTVRNMLNYVETFCDVHEVNVTAGSEIRSNKYTGVTTTGYGWNPDYGDKFMPVMTSNFVSGYVNTGALLPVNNNPPPTNVASFLASAIYSYDKRYVINGNVRSDAANKFGTNPKYRWLPTWSVAGKWIVTGEQFMQKARWADEIALRASYGLQGNIHEDSTPNLIVKTGQRDPVSGLDYSTIVRLPNPDLRWEKTRSWDVAIDFSLLRNRVKGSFDIYKKHTSDLIMSKDVPSSTGRTYIYMNSGEMDNTGFEGFINVEVIRAKKWDWRVGFNFGRDVNQVTLANTDAYTVTEEVTMRLAGNYPAQGQPVGTLYSYRFAGLSPDNGLPLFYAKDGSKVHFGATDLMELVACGSIFSNLAGGFDTQVTFNRALSLSVAFTYNLGGARRLPTYYEDTYHVLPDPLYNASTALAKRWKSTGDEYRTKIPAITDYEHLRELAKNPDLVAKGNTLLADYNYPTVLYNNSDERVVSSDFLRLRMIALSYTLPKSLLSKVRIQSAQLRLQATNLHVWASSKWNGLDPESYQGAYPVLPVYSLGVNITF